LYTQTRGEAWLLVWALAALLLLSPAFTWFGLVLAAPLVAVGMDRGWFGWLPALALGAAIGVSLGMILDTPLALPFGLTLAAILRATTARLAPQAF